MRGFNSHAAEPHAAQFPRCQGGVRSALPRRPRNLTLLADGRPARQFPRHRCPAQAHHRPRRRRAGPHHRRGGQTDSLQGAVHRAGRNENTDLGPIIRAHGCDNQYRTANGSFSQAFPPGSYHLVITRGIEYDHVERDVDIAAGRMVAGKAKLRPRRGHPPAG